MDASLTEVLTHLRVWRDDGTALLVDVRMPAFAAVFFGRVVEVTDERVVLRDPESGTEARIDFRLLVRGWFNDMREYPQLADRLDQSLWLVFPYQESEPNAPIYAIILSEVRVETQT